MTQSIHTAPAGLRAAFKMIAFNDHTATAAAADADHSYPHAQRILEILNATGDDSDIAEELDRATSAIYPGIDLPTDTATTATAAMYVGFAVCWLLMMAVSGKAGAR